MSCFEILSIVAALFSAAAILLVVVFEYRMNRRPYVVALHYRDASNQLRSEELIDDNNEDSGQDYQQSDSLHQREYILTNDSIEKDWHENNRVDEEEQQYLLIQNIGDSPAEDLVIFIHYPNTKTAEYRVEPDLMRDDVLYIRRLPTGSQYYVPCARGIHHEGDVVTIWENRWSLLYRFSRFFSTTYFETTVDNPVERRKGAYSRRLSRAKAWCSKIKTKRRAVKWLRVWDYPEECVGYWRPVNEKESIYRFRDLSPFGENNEEQGQ